MALTQVRSDGIATGAVGADQIATGAVTANDLEDSGVTAGTYGSSSAIPAITVDAKGRVTSASTNSIDSTSISNGTSNVSVIEDANIQFIRGGTTQLEVDGSGLLFQDSKKIRMGGSADLEIYHSGNDTFINHDGTGNLYLQTLGAEEDIYIRSADNIYIQPNATENGIVVTGGGGVNLYHNNGTKLNTTSTGVNVTGTVTCDGLTSDGNLTMNASNGRMVVQDSDNTGVAATPRVEGTQSNGGAKWRFGNLSSGNDDVYVANDTNNKVIFNTNLFNRAYVDSTGFHPISNNTYDLGTSSLRWANVYTNDLNLSNEGGTNDVDGTWGSWTIQEGEDDLFLLNRRNGKKYKFNLTEVN